MTIGRWLVTNGLRFYLQAWYAKQALFWLPQDWLPSYVEWLLAFPRAPRGGISIQVWGVACASVIKLVSAAVMAVYALVVQQKAGNEKGEPMKMSASGGGERKKEL